MDKSDIKASIVRGKIGDKTTYARIPVRNLYPLPTEDTHPIEALRLYLRYIGFSLSQKEEKDENLIEIVDKALRIFKTFEVVDTEWVEKEE